MTLTAERLKELLEYDTKTGVFRRRYAYAGMPAGRITGTVSATHNDRKVSVIWIDGKSYRAHRLAWLWVHGEWPSDQIDHIDKDSLNNRIANLRIATNAQNQRNRKAHKNNKSGFKGVSWSNQSRKWRATIEVDGKQNCLGFFTTPESAHQAYAAASQKLHGEFGRVA